MIFNIYDISFLKSAYTAALSELLFNAKYSQILYFLDPDLTFEMKIELQISNMSISSLTV